MPNEWITDWAEGPMSTGGMTAIRCIDAWLDFTQSPPVLIGIVPANSLIIGAMLYVPTPFDGADLIELSIGYDGMSNAYVSGYIISHASTAFVVPDLPGLGHGVEAGDYLGTVIGTLYEVLATWQPILESPTQGKVHVAIFFAQTAPEP